MYYCILCHIVKAALSKIIRKESVLHLMFDQILKKKRKRPAYIKTVLQLFNIIYTF